MKPGKKSQRTMLQSIYIFMLLLSGFLIAPMAMAQTKQTLDQLYASNLGTQVMIYSAGIYGGFNYDRRCLDLEGSTTGSSSNLVIWDCDFSKPNQKWFLDRSGSVRSMVDPTQCITFPDGYYTGISTCSSAPGASQTLVFQANGNITNTAGTTCLDINNNNSGNGWSVGSYKCWSTTANNQIWTIQPDPTVFVSLSNVKTGHVLDATGGKSRGSPLVSDANTTALSQLFFETPANDGTSAVYLQSAETGYCMVFWSDTQNTETYPCAAPGYDQSEKWTLSTGTGGTQFSMKRTGSAIDWTVCALSSTLGEGCYYNITAPQQALNVNMINITTGGDASCVAASGTSNIAKLDCSTTAQVLQASMDILPKGGPAPGNFAIRFRQTGQYLDNFNWGGTVGQYSWNGGSNQLWVPPLGIGVETQIAFVNQSINAKLLLNADLKNGLLSANIAPTVTNNYLWYLMPASAMSFCFSDTTSSSSRTPRSPPPQTAAQLWQQLATLTIDMIALVNDNAELRNLPQSPQTVTRLNILHTSILQVIVALQDGEIVADYETLYAADVYMAGSSILDRLFLTPDVLTPAGLNLGWTLRGYLNLIYQLRHGGLLDMTQQACLQRVQNVFPQ